MNIQVRHALPLFGQCDIAFNFRRKVMRQFFRADNFRKVEAADADFALNVFFHHSQRALCLSHVGCYAEIGGAFAVGAVGGTGVEGGNSAEQDLFLRLRVLDVCFADFLQKSLRGGGVFQCYVCAAQS